MIPGAGEVQAVETASVRAAASCIPHPSLHWDRSLGGDFWLSHSQRLMLKALQTHKTQVAPADYH